LIKVRANIIFASLLCVLINFAPALSHAEGCSPVQVSLWSSLQLVPKEKEICGARLDLLWGENTAVWGIDAGLVNNAGSIRGIEAGALVNRLKSAPETPATQSWGLQMAGLVNSNRSAPFAGIQAAGLVNDHDDASFRGIQLAGLVNDNDRASYKGIQIALFSNQNFESEVTGLQLALFNHAKTFNGVQIGLGNGVSAGEGAVAMIVVPICLLAALGGGSGPCPLYEDKSAHKDQAVNGVQIGVFANVTEDLNGFQISPFFNGARHSMSGVQVAFFMNTAGDTEGLQLAAIGNIVQGNMDGLQVGVVNIATRDVTGLQVGIINVCKNLKGMQIGAVNVVWGRFPSSVFFAPIINIGF
jgi:hypothetical protein